MGKRAVIIDVSDDRISENRDLKDYIERHTSKSVLHMVEGELLVVIKDVQKGEHLTEGVRMLAGEIARQLGKLKIDQANVSTEILDRVFSDVDTNKVVTAFVEGWHLGNYDYVKHQSKEARYKTELHIDGEDRKSVV